MRQFSYEDIEAATGGFAVKNLIGKGSHGSVYRARLRGGRLVAVKKPSHAHGDAKLWNEIEMHACARGVGVVGIVGVAETPGTGVGGGCRVLVMELMRNGSLHDLLHASAKPPPWRRRLAVAADVARAVRSLHDGAPRVIHRDIKSANVLLGRGGRARLGDFGLAVRHDASEPSTPATAPAGTLGYIDPCYTDASRLGPESDVFSFGVLLLELVSARKPLDVELDPSSVVSWAVPLIKSGRVTELCDKRVPVPAAAVGALGRVLRVAARCVSGTPERRPAMAEVVDELQGALQSARGWSPRVVQKVYRRVLSWRLHARGSKIECTEHSEGSAILDHDL